ncbi:MAG: hypothetical protein CMF96_08510 [Candidatus Marinimicrobia bacterium]|nr:hypothetical protein [Candidatus Neomarinimicrobiota bacterium]|tara:strand:+ start:10085 stop:10318 length:234 start_codon:yes stop_codon:yes gene_type:complete
MENQDKITEFEAKIKRIEEKLNTSMIYDESFFKRAIGIFGHNLVGQIILFIPIIFILGLLIGIFSLLFFPAGFDQGW